MRLRYRLFLLAAYLTAVGITTAADPDPASSPVPNLVVSETGEYSPAAECDADAAQLLDVRGRSVGCEFWTRGEETPRKLIQLGSAQPFVVEPLNATLVAADAASLLKYGTFSNVALGPGERFAWILYSSAGDRVAERQGDLAGDAAVAMSADGYFVIVDRGTGTGNGERSKITLYAPSGEEIASAALGVGEFATQVAVSNGGERIALTLTDARKYRDGGTDLVLYAKSGERIGAIEQIRYPSALVFTETADPQLLASARGLLMLVAAEDARVRWQSQRFYRLAWPISAAVSPDGRYLTLVTTEVPPKPERDYRGRAHLLSMVDGRQLSVVDLPGSFKTGGMPVTTQFTERLIELKSPDRQVIRIAID